MVMVVVGMWVVMVVVVVMVVMFRDKGSRSWSDNDCTVFAHCGVR